MNLEKKNSNVKIDNENQDKKKINMSKDNDMEECDRLIKQLDEMEQNGGQVSISSRARRLIEQDRTMNESRNQVNDDDDEANIDFLGNLNKDDKVGKQQPERPNSSNNNLTMYIARWIVKLKKISHDNIKNFCIGTAIAFLFVVLLIALIVDAGNDKRGTKEESRYVTEFLDIDTTPMVTTINNYYAALVNGEKEVVKNLLVDESKVTDEDVDAKCEEAKAYAELVGSSFLVTDCYIQQGIKKNEYIAYMKFQIQIKSIETPSVGIFTCYFIDESTEDKINYKISTDVNDKSSEVYKYIIKMSSCQNVTDLFDKVDKELEEACAKDPQLKAIVDALEQSNNSDSINEDSDKQSDDGETTKPIEAET